MKIIGKAIISFIILTYQIQYVYAQSLNSLSIDDQILKDQLKQKFKMDKLEMFQKLKDQNKVAFLDYAYIVEESKEPMVKQYFENLGLRIFHIHQNLNLHDFMYINFAFKCGKINYKIFKEGQQIANQIQGVMSLSDKMKLVYTLRKFDELKLYTNYNSTNFFMKSIMLNYNAKKNLTNEEKNMLSMNESDWFILKPAVGFGGEGIQVIKNLYRFQTKFLIKKQLTVSNNYFILQRYIIDPMLLDNKKFDIRYYCVIPSVKPLMAMLYKGFIRKSMFNYSIDREAEDDDFMYFFIQTNKISHITNQAKQRLHPMYSQEDTIILFPQMDQELLNQNKTQEEIKQMYKMMNDAILYTLKAGINEFSLKQGFFQFLTFDFMLEKDLKPILIEVNRSPSWNINNQIYADLKTKLFKTTMDLVLFLNSDVSKLHYHLQNIDNLDFDLSDFEIIINEAVNYEHKIE